RETQIRLFSQSEQKGAPAPNFEVALGLPTSNNYNIRMQKSADPGEGLPFFNAGLLVQRNKQIYDREQWIGALMLSTWAESGSHAFEAEWVNGVDPYKTEMAHLYANGRAVYFSGMKTGYTFDFDESRRSGWQLLASTSLLQNDTRNPLDRSAQLVSGINYYFKKTRIAFNLELTGMQNPLVRRDWSYERSQAQIELRQEI
ncbi:MAG TPA: hypothetical protein VE954_14230, partial [Oligoflexus sp.]|uniref:hypothetical protein n=1 Tax=Oligoflexus sp. TaxID=1971216 RepID=UPI002D25111E